MWFNVVKAPKQVTSFPQRAVSKEVSMEVKSLYQKAEEQQINYFLNPKTFHE